MLLNNFNGDYDYWSLYHKCTFDGINKIITVNPGVSAINVQIDIYSDWKEWVRLDPANVNPTQRVDNSRYEAALRTIGGDPTSGGDFAGDIYFLINGWQVQVNEQVRFTGALFSDDFSSPFIIAPGGGVESTVSSLVTRIIPTLTDQDFANIGSIVNAATGNISVSATATVPASTIANAVWNSLLEDFLIQNSFGEYVQKKILKKTTFIALK